jgi:predicted MarR family transcription regulator
MNNRAKTLSEVGRILNRHDMFNVQYSVRKLVKQGLIEKITGSSQRTAFYQVTTLGMQHTEQFFNTKKKTLIAKFSDLDQKIDLELLAKELAKIRILYDESDLFTKN